MITTSLLGKETISEKAAFRVPVIDVLRGLVMVIMALDHVREFWSQTPFRPEDLTQTSVPLYFTRWVTHFCAPVFVFLSGTSIYLAQQRRSGRREMSMFLLKRGFWLIFLEVTLISFLWQFSYQLILIQVIWAIGWGMVLLAGLIWIPRRLVLGVVVVMIAGHNMLPNLSPVTPANFFAAVVHNGPFAFPLPPLPVIFFSYTLVPWVAVMAMGYLAGSWFVLPAKERNRYLTRAGITLLLLFVVLRLPNLYGDPFPWSAQSSALRTVLSFINVTKYPPSLLFLSLTLGIAWVLVPWLDRLRGPVMKWLGTFGSVPMFYYLLHIPLISLSAIIWAYIEFDVLTVVAFTSPDQWPSGYEPSLLRAYIVWMLVMTALYFPCRWYSRYKANHRTGWLSYI